VGYNSCAPAEAGISDAMPLGTRCHQQKKRTPPSPAGLRSVTGQRLGCAVAFIGFSVPPRAFHGRLNNPGHKRVEFRDEASDVPGKAFDGVIANVKPVASPVMVLR